MLFSVPRSHERASAARFHLSGRLFRACLCALIASTLVCGAFEEAFADVRKSDIIYGEAMGERGIKATSCPTIGAEYAYVCNAEGEEFFARNADAPAQIASVTKIMTAVLALEQGDMGQRVTVSSSAANVGGSTSDLRAGDELSMADALKGLMVPSGNDAAVAIAETLGAQFQKQSKEDGRSLHRHDGSAIDPDDPARTVDAFVARMNEKATELGCTNTLFTNPHGLDDDQFGSDLHSTAREVSIISAYAMKMEEFRSLVDLKEAELAVKRAGEDITVTVETTDELLGAYEGACGIKTGNAELAGPCFAGACEREGEELYAIILKSTSEEQRFIDCTTLYDWVFNNQVDYKLAHSSQTAQMRIDGQEREVPIVADVALSGWVDKTVPATFADPDASVAVFAPNGNVSQSFDLFDVGGGVTAGQTVGKATFWQNNSVVAEVDVVACETVAAPNLFEGIGIWWDKAMRSFSNEPTQAESVIINDTPLLLENA